MTSEEHAPSGGVTGLGKMPSMDPKCTPLKHSYDACFNLWFEEYLGIDKSRPAPAHNSHMSAAPVEPRDAPSEGRRSWLKPWSRPAPDDESSASSATAYPSAADGQRQRQTRYAHLPSDALAAQAKRTELKAKFDDCSELFASYQACVRAAVHERELEPLIEEARVYNPFPFPKQ